MKKILDDCLSQICAVDFDIEKIIVNINFESKRHGLSEDKKFLSMMANNFESIKKCFIERKESLEAKIQKFPKLP